MGATPMTRKLRSCRAGMRKLNLSFRWCQNLSMHLLPSRVKVLFFTYGQTGTGKSHTMLGADESFHDGWGIFPLLVRSQFTHVYPLGFGSGILPWPSSLWCRSERQPVGQKKVHLQNQMDLMNFLQSKQSHYRIHSNEWGKRQSWRI